jgi:uncharacterized protein (DUF4415 family)
MKNLQGGMKKTDPKLLAKIRKEHEKEFDFSKLEPRVVTINLDNEIVDYFKNLSMKTGKGYQVLIKDALKYFIEEKLEPKNVWKK